MKGYKMKIGYHLQRNKLNNEAELEVIEKIKDYILSYYDTGELIERFGSDPTDIDKVDADSVQEWIYAASDELLDKGYGIFTVDIRL
jgi:hypothetical protein